MGWVDLQYGISLHAHRIENQYINGLVCHAGKYTPTVRNVV